MLTQPRLGILSPEGFGSRARQTAIRAMFGGMVPAAIHVSLVKTRLDRSPFERWRRKCNRGSDVWSRAQMELFGAFVSARNGCVF